MTTKSCGCWDESTSGMCFSLSDPKPMPERSEFTGFGSHLSHFCELHWQQRQDAEARYKFPRHAQIMAADELPEEPSDAT